MIIYIYMLFVTPILSTVHLWIEHSTMHILARSVVLLANPARLG